MSRLLKPIDALLNRVTMYRLALYYLVGLLAIALVFSATGILPYDPYALLVSVGFLVGVCGLTNAVFARAFGVTPNVESAYITALILALIITPVEGLHDFWFLGWAGALAMASKYILAIRQRHLFNPVAIGVAITYFTIDQSASWWVGTPALLPFVALGGLLLVRKLERGDMAATFLVASLAFTAALAAWNGDSIVAALQSLILYSPLAFFAAIILTEPLTMPPTQALRLVYAALVGVLISPAFHIASFYLTPELAIMAGNLLALLAGRRAALTMVLQRRVQLAPDIVDFLFVPSRRLAFAPGQYMEWTLGHDDPDARGNRRFFTLASSPTEAVVRVGVKFAQPSSSYKQALLAMQPGDEVSVTHLDGDFILPSNPAQPCVLIAGGIGITPFRSFVKYALDTGQRRAITLLYAVRHEGDFVYSDVFEQAERTIGLRMIRTVTDSGARKRGWRGPVGRITPEMIMRQVPEYQQCLFYLSGPRSMIDAFRSALAELGIPPQRIKIDYFSGLS